MSASRAQGESRRERDRRAQRRERLIIAGLVGLLTVAGIVVLVGLYVTQYLPPRAHVLRVGRERTTTPPRWRAAPSTSCSSARPA